MNIYQPVNSVFYDVGALSHSDLNNSLNQLLPICPYKDIALIIISNLNLKTLGKCSTLNKNWKILTDHIFVIKKIEIYPLFFNSEDWYFYFENFHISEEEMINFFKSLSPIMDETISLKEYGVSYIPKNLTLNIFLDFFKRNKIYIVKEIIDKYGDIKIEESFLSIGKKTLLAESKGKNYEELEELLKDGDEMPTILQTVILIITQKIKFKEDLFHFQVIKCQEYLMIDGVKQHIHVMMAPYGITIHAGLIGFKENTGTIAFKVIEKK